jgi:site-specific recombinase XerD
VGPDCGIDSITPKIIARFLASRNGLSKKTLLNYHTALSSLWTHLVRNEIVEKNIVRVVVPPEPEIKQATPFTRGEINALLDEAERSEHSVRNRVLILLLLDTGMRASEICNLRSKDINLQEKRVRVAGKGDKERRIPFCQATRDNLEKYLSVRGIEKFQKRNERVFVTCWGNSLDRHGLRHILERLSHRAGVQGCHPHRFRHTFAIQFLRNGGNVYTLQALLGHTSLDMVKKYLAIAQTDIDGDHAKASPVKGWGFK